MKIMKKDLEVMNTIKRRKLEYLGHIIRNKSKYHLLKSVHHEKVLWQKTTRKKENIMTSKLQPHTNRHMKKKKTNDDQNISCLFLKLFFIHVSLI